MPCIRKRKDNEIIFLFYKIEKISQFSSVSQVNRYLIKYSYARRTPPSPVIVVKSSLHLVGSASVKMADAMQFGSIPKL